MTCLGLLSERLSLLVKPLVELSKTCRLELLCGAQLFSRCLVESFCLSPGALRLGFGLIALFGVFVGAGL